MKEALCLSMTVARFGIAEKMARSAKDGKSIVLPMLAFVATDILDGVIARKVDSETRLRRATDSVVDRLSILRVSYEVAKSSKQVKRYLGLLALGELASSVANVLHTKKTGEVVSGGILHKVDSLLTAGFGVIATSNNSENINTFGTIAVGAKLLSTADYITNSMHPRGIVDQNHVRSI